MTFTTPTAPPAPTSAAPARRERRVAEAYMGKCTTHVTHIALFIIGFSALVFGLWKEREINRLKEKFDDLEARFNLAEINHLGRSLESPSGSSTYRRMKKSDEDDESRSKEIIRRYEVSTEGQGWGPFHSSIYRRKREAIDRVAARPRSLQVRSRRARRRRLRAGQNGKAGSAGKVPASPRSLFPGLLPLMPPAPVPTSDSFKQLKSSLDSKRAVQFSFDIKKNEHPSRFSKKKKKPHHHHHQKNKNTSRYSLDPLNLFGYKHGVVAGHYEANNDTQSSNTSYNDTILRNWKETSWMLPLSNDTFTMEDGVVTVVQPGLYLIYAQVEFLDGRSSNGYNVIVNNQTVATCTTELRFPRRPEENNSCQTSTTALVHKGSRVYLQQFYDQPISKEAQSTFFGLVNLGIP